MVRYPSEWRLLWFALRARLTHAQNTEVSFSRDREAGWRKAHGKCWARTNYALMHTRIAVQLVSADASLDFTIPYGEATEFRTKAPQKQNIMKCQHDT